MTEDKKPRYFQTTGGTKFREFGIVKDVMVNEWGVWITNEEGEQIGMKKVYHDWVAVAQKAKRLVGSPALTETGGSGHSREYFRDIYSNSFPNEILDFPEDAGHHAQTQIVWARVQREQAKYELYYERQRSNQLSEDVEHLTRSQREQQDAAVEEIGKVWGDWVADPNQTFHIVAAAYGSKDLPDKLDKAFALRLGFSTMKKKHINVRVLKRTYNNNVLVELPDYGDMKCQMALIKGSSRGVVGEWCIQTVMNTLSGFEPLEKELYGNWRTSRKPIEYYMDAHATLLEALVERAA